MGYGNIFPVSGPSCPLGLLGSVSAILVVQIQTARVRLLRPGMGGRIWLALLHKKINVTILAEPDLFNSDMQSTSNDVWAFTN